MRRLVVAAAVALAAACSSSSSNPFTPGTESFTSSPPGYRGGTVGADGGGTPTAGPTGPAGPAAAPSGSGGETATRAVEEADVYERVGSTLYVLNAYRGLQIVDVSDPAAPRLLGRQKLGGVPVELYLRGGVALVLTREHVEHVIEPATGAVRAGISSMFWAVDVSDPARPSVLTKLPIEGSLEATRIVGDVLYLVSDRRQYGYGIPVPMIGDGAVAVGAAGGADVAQGGALVASVDVSDVRAPRVVQTLSFPALGWSPHANVTSDRITLSFSGWEGTGPVTRFRAIDISDPGGAMVIGAEARAAGEAQDRWALDYDPAKGIFRAVVANGWRSGATLYVFHWPAVGDVQQTGALALDVAEQLTATRFDGDRVYAVTAVVQDPLWVIDTSDPRAPRLAGHLEMPGQLDHVEPRGDRLVAFGHTNEAGGWWRLHVSLIDVSSAARPLLMKREVFGPDSGWVPATRDDFRKVFLVLDDLGLVVVPFQGWSSTAYTWSGGTQLLSFGHDTLALEGFLSHAGDVKRAFPIATGRLAAFSDAALQTIDASDPARPVELGRIDLARPVLDVEIANGVAVQAVGDGWRSGVEIVVTPAADPDAPTPLARLAFHARSARLFGDGDVVWALAADWQTEGELVAVDVSNPAAPRVRGKVAVPGGTGTGGWWWGGLSDAVMVGHTLAVHQRGSGAWCARGPCDGVSVLVFDLADADAPRLAATLAAPGASWLGGLVAAPSSIWVVHYAWLDDGTWSRVRYHASRIELGATPRIAETVNVPGMLLSATDDGRLYTWETTWPEPTVLAADVIRPYDPTTWLHALELTGRGTARLVASTQVKGSGSGFVADGGFAYGMTTAYADSTYHSGLVSIRLDPLAVVSERIVGDGWANLVAAKAGKVFLQSGWPAQELLVYAATPAGAEFQLAAPAPGWPTDVAVADGAAYVACGPYGVTVVPLGGVSSTP